MPEDVGIRLTADGEAEFSSSLKMIAQRSRELASELKAVTSAFDSNDKSMNKLASQASVLSKQIETQKSKIDILSKSLSDNEALQEELRQAAIQAAEAYGENSEEAAKAAQAYDKQSQAVSKSRTELNNAVSALNKMESQLSSVQAEMTQSSSATDKLTSTISEQQEALDEVKKAYADAVIQYGKNSSEAKGLGKQITELSGELAENEKQLKEASDAADQLDQSMEDASESSSRFADVLKASVLSDVITSGFSALKNAISSCASALADLVKSAVSSYAEYEQLVGGVETLFGDSADALMEYAAQAYKTAGLSANDYMEQATGFAASLIQGLGGDTAKAVELVDLAITDMADNANKMGTDITSIQNAYQGFAKQNYTMLDNLKLGYGGTQEEMIRLINDAGILNETISSLDDVTFDQMIEAIHVIQEELGITGTTALEASTTLQGTAASVSALWENITTKIGAVFAPTLQKFLSSLSEWMETVDWDALVGSLEDALDDVLTWLENVDFQQVFEGMLDGIQTVISVFSWLIDNFGLVVAGIEAIAVAVGILNAVFNANPVGLIISAIAVLITLIVQVVTHLDNIKAAASSVCDAVGQYFKNAGKIISAAFSAAADFISGVFNSVKGWITDVSIWYAEKTLAAKDAVVSAFQAIGDFISSIFDTIQTIIGNVAQWFVDRFNDAEAGVASAIQAVGSVFSSVFNSVRNVVTTVTAAIQSGFTTAFNAVKTAINSVGAYFSNLWNSVTSGFTGLISQAKTWGVDMIQGFINGIKSMISKVTDAVKSIGNTIKSFLGFSVPDKGPLHEYETWMPDFMIGLAKGISDNAYRVEDAIASLSSRMVIQTDSGSGSTTNYGGFNIVVNAAPGQDVNQIANAVMRKLQHQVSQREAVFA